MNYNLPCVVILSLLFMVLWLVDRFIGLHAINTGVHWHQIAEQTRCADLLARLEVVDRVALSPRSPCTITSHTAVPVRVAHSGCVRTEYRSDVFGAAGERTGRAHVVELYGYDNELQAKQRVQILYPIGSNSTCRFDD